MVTRQAPPARIGHEETPPQRLSRRRRPLAPVNLDVAVDTRERAPVRLSVVRPERGAQRPPMRDQRTGQETLERRLVAIAVVLAVLLAAAAVTFLLSGCADTYSPAPRPVMVNVPVAAPVYCKVPQLAHPALPLAGLGANSPPANTIRSYAATVAILKAAVVQRDRILAGCAAPAAVPTPASSATPPDASAAALTDPSAAAPLGHQDGQDPHDASTSTGEKTTKKVWRTW
ncbi:MAG TPA: hypothetical protein VIX59_14700 [Candidatus Binataceae bacterium]